MEEKRRIPMVIAKFQGPRLAQKNSPPYFWEAVSLKAFGLTNDRELAAVLLAQDIRNQEEIDAGGDSLS